jgi:hypothetical protein
MREEGRDFGNSSSRDMNSLCSVSIVRVCDSGALATTYDVGFKPPSHQTILFKRKI